MAYGISLGVPRGRTRVVALLISALIVAFGLAACDPADRVLTLRIHDSAIGAPAANVTVAVFASSALESGPVASGVTNDAGVVHFSASALGAGSYALRFGSAPFEFGGEVIAGSENERWWNGPAADAGSSADDAAIVEVGGSSTPVEVSESYAVPRGSIRNRVATPVGDPVDAMTVTAYAGPSAKAVATTTTNASGFYELTGLPAQNYKLGFSKPGHATFYAGINANDQTHSLDEAPQVPALVPPHELPGGPNVVSEDGIIKGRTVDGTTPVPGVVVLAFTAASDQFVTSVTSDSDASFNINGLPAGSYRLLAYDPSGRYATTVHGSRTPNLSGGTQVAAASAPAPTTLISMGGLDCPRAQQGDSQLVGADLRNCDLRGAALSGANLTDAVLTDTNLTNTNLAGANLTSARLTRTIVNGTNLTGANLHRIRARELVSNPGPAALPQYWKVFSGALFGPYADLSNMNINLGSSLHQQGVSLQGASFNGSQIRVRNLFYGVQISEATFEGAYIHDQMFYGYLHHINFRGATLSNIEFEGGLGLSHIDFSFANFDGVTSFGTMVDNIMAAGATGTIAGTIDQPMGGYWRWNGWYFEAQGPANILFGTDYTGSSVLRGRNLAGWDMRNIKLVEADLTGTDLRGANMTGADLRGANLTNAKLDGAISSGLTADAATILPPGWSIVGGVLVKS